MIISRMGFGPDILISGNVALVEEKKIGEGSTSVAGNLQDVLISPLSINYVL